MTEEIVNFAKEIEDAELSPVEGREIGIDLGTTNSVVSYLEKGQLENLKIRRKEIIPSAIFFKSSTEIFYGERAVKRGIQYPNSVVKLFKRRLKDKKDKFQIEFADQENDKNENEVEAKTYVIDTNIFIDEPYILDKFSEKDKVILASTVLEELGYRKGDEDTKYQAEEAIKKINEMNDELIFAESDTSLLPEDFFKQDEINNEKNDNLILSVVLKYKDDNPILLTSDNGLQIKAKNLGVDYKNLKEFEADTITRVKKNKLISLTGEEASTKFLRYLKDKASKELGEVSKAVITVPANFNNVEIEATKRAGENAGFKEVKILKEPTAAAIAYGYEEEEDKKILVYDFGGGTFDVSIIEAQSNGTFKVINTGGNSSLGGEDLTKELMYFIYDKLFDEFDIDMEEQEYSSLNNKEFLHNKAEIYKVAEEVKKNLSESEKISIDLANIYIESGVQDSISFKVTREQFENLIRDYIIEARDTLTETIKESNLLAEDIDIIVLAGGTSRIPIIQKKAKDFFGKQPNYSKDTATVIAQGAALRANDIWSQGDAIQEKIKIIDKTIDDFGVGIKGRKFDLLIPIGTELPAKKSKDYSPAEDNQEEIRIVAYSRAKNHQSATRTIDKGVEYLDEIVISNLPPMKQHEIDITVTFELTKEYILKVDAEIKDASGNLIDTGELEIQKESTM